MDFQVGETDPAEERQIAVYFADWKMDKRMVRVQVLSTDIGIVLAENALSDYTYGIYLIYRYRGKITIRVENMSNPLKPPMLPEATVSAFFWQ